MNYIFHIPNYVPNSNGIKSLWYAAYQFSLHRSVKIIPFYAGEVFGHEIPQPYKEIIVSNYSMSEKDIVIYPDMVEGNPLGAKKIARYLMAKPGILNGLNINKGDTDFLFAYSRAVDKTLPQLTILLPELEFLKKFKKEKKEKTIIIYYGKCRVSLKDTRIKKIRKDFDNVKIITRIIPSDKNVLYEEISKASLLVSYDPLSSLAYEANLVGTPSVILDPVFRDEFNIFNHQLPGFYYEYDAIKSQDFTHLGNSIFEKSHADLRNFIVNTKFEVLNLINNIEIWFDNATKKESNALINAEIFYNENWEKSPIINCTTLESVIAYNLIRKSILIYIVCSVIYKTLRFIGVKPKLFFTRCKTSVLKAYFSDNERNIIKWKLYPESVKVGSGMDRLQIPDIPIFKIGKDFKSFVWKVSCM